MRTGVLLVIVEILLTEKPVLISYETISLNKTGVKFDLDLDILRNREQRPGQLTYKDSASLCEVVDICIITISFICELLHPGVLEISHPKSEERQVHSLLPLLFHQTHKVRCARDSNIEVSVGSPHNPVVALRLKVVIRDAVGKKDSLATRGTSARREFLYRFQDFWLVVPARGWE